MTNDFLVELGTEELPPNALLKLSQAFNEGIEKGLKDANVDFVSTKAFATPRRLAVLVSELASKAKTQMIERKGPALNAAFDNKGQPTKACLGFARSCGVNVEDLEKQETEKGSWLIYQHKKEGESVKNLLPGIVDKAISVLPVPKYMRWGATDVSFARPVHWLVMLYGKEVIHASLLGQTASNITYGHRFHHPQAIVLTAPSDYEKALLEAKVIADYAIRQEKIKKTCLQLAKEKKAFVFFNESLLKEVTAIVEWPVPLLASFDKRFLQVPQEALIAAMESHQKSFALTKENGALLPMFIFVANIESTCLERVVEGNEKVMGARLSDAEFFYEQDKKTPLGSRVEASKTVVFQKDLGSLFDKSQRLVALSEFIASVYSLDEKQVKRAAKLSRCDLLSDMVCEFPELQGTMGRYYALYDNEDEAVANALFEQYLPRFAGDKLPESTLGFVLALAERVDTLVGIFAIGQKPSGTKDPFKLRRQALGLIRLILDNDCSLTMDVLLKKSQDTFSVPFKNQQALSEVKQFILDRLTGYYIAKGVSIDIINAVFAVQKNCLLDIDKRVKAMMCFSALPEAEALAKANKRVSNLLSKEQINVKELVHEKAFFSLDAEHQLANALMKINQQLPRLLKQQEYEQALGSLATLKTPVDKFFTDVMVLVEDEKIKNNRLALLFQLHQAFIQIADISLLNITKA